MIKASYINEIRLIFNVLEAIEDLLKLDDWFNTYKTEQSVALIFERYGGLDALEDL